MSDEAVTVTASIDLPSSLRFQRLCALGRVLGLGIAIDGPTIALLPDAAASTRAPAWSGGEIRLAEGLTVDGKTIEGGLLCSRLFGDLRALDLRRYGHIPLPEPVVPWPARARLAELLDESEEALAELCATDPDALVARVEKAEAGQELLWWSIPVISPALRAASLEDARQFEGDAWFTRTLNDAYRSVTNRANRLRRLKELDSPLVILQVERRMLSRALDQLLANAELEEPRMHEDTEELVMDMTTLFFESLTPRMAEAGGWLAIMAEIGRAREGEEPRLSALWRLAAERPTMPLERELFIELADFEPARR